LFTTTDTTLDDRREDQKTVPGPDDRHQSDSLETEGTQLEAPTLRREAIMVSRDHGRLAIVFAICTMAGVAMGFGLRGMTATCPAHRQAVQRTAKAPPPSASCQSGCTWLGIQMIETRRGVRVVRVFDGSPAAELRAGGLLIPGDFITTVGGKRVRRAAQVVQIIRDREPGDSVSMRLRRPGQEAVVMLDAELGWITGARFHRLAVD